MGPAGCGAHLHSVRVRLNPLNSLPSPPLPSSEHGLHICPIDESYRVKQAGTFASAFPEEAFTPRDYSAKKRGGGEQKLKSLFGSLQLRLVIFELCWP